MTEIYVFYTFRFNSCFHVFHMRGLRLAAPVATAPPRPPRAASVAVSSKTKTAHSLYNYSEMFNLPQEIQDQRIENYSVRTSASQLQTFVSGRKSQKDNRPSTMSGAL